MKEKTKNLLRIILSVLDSILHLFIKKEDTPSQNPDHSHPELVSGSDQLVSGSEDNDENK